MYYANYIASSEISNHINTKHRILKGKSKSKKCIPDFIEIHSVKYRDKTHYGLLARESLLIFLQDLLKYSDQDKHPPKWR